MEGTLLVAPEALQNTASEFQSQAGTVKNLHDTMLQKVAGTTEIFIGDAADQYRNKFANLSSAMDAINRQICEHVKDLQEMAQNYIKTESDDVNLAEVMPEVGEM